jgi:hypothetical protein
MERVVQVKHVRRNVEKDKYPNKHASANVFNQNTYYSRP